MQVEDVASIAQVSRSHRKLAAEVLWPALGRRYRSASLFAYAHHHLGCKVRKMLPDLTPAEAAEAFEESDCPWFVPRPVFHEFQRLSRVGISASNLGPEFGLAEADMAAAGLEATMKSRGAYGSAKLYPLGHILSLARVKHGDVAGLALALQAKKDASAARKAAAAAKAAAKAAARLAAIKVLCIAWKCMVSMHVAAPLPSNL